MACTRTQVLCAMQGHAALESCPVALQTLTSLVLHSTRVLTPGRVVLHSALSSLVLVLSCFNDCREISMYSIIYNGDGVSREAHGGGEAFLKVGGWLGMSYGECSTYLHRIKGSNCCTCNDAGEPGTSSDRHSRHAPLQCVIFSWRRRIQRGFRPCASACSSVQKSICRIAASMNGKTSDNKDAYGLRPRVLKCFVVGMRQGSQFQGRHCGSDMLLA